MNFSKQVVKEINFRTNFFSPPRILKISDTYVSLSFLDQEIIRIVKDNILDFRIGVKWIKGFEFTIGRIYSIDIRDRNKKTLKIRLKSLYKINNRKLYHKYCNIINDLYFCIIDKQIAKYKSEIEEGNEIEIAKTFFNKKGILFKKGKINNLILWDDILINEYFEYFVLSSKSNSNIYKSYTYLSDWNSIIVYSLIKSVLL